MTSLRKFQSRRIQLEELRIFDGLSAPLRAAINEAEASVRPSVVRDTLLRGVPEHKIIEVLTKRSHKP